MAPQRPVLLCYNNVNKFETAVIEMGQAVTRWVWLPAPVVTRQSTFKIHAGDLQLHPVPLQAAQWYRFDWPRPGRICAMPIPSDQHAAFIYLAAQAIGNGQVGVLPAPERPIMTRATMISFTR